MEKGKEITEKIDIINDIGKITIQLSRIQSVVDDDEQFLRESVQFIKLVKRFQFFYNIPTPLHYDIRR